MEGSEKNRVQWFEILKRRRVIDSQTNRKIRWRGGG